MRRRTIAAPIGLLAALLLAPAAPASAATPTLAGTVTVAGAVRAGVPVAWYTPGERAISVTTTDAAGAYSLPAPAAGVSYVVALNVRDPLTAPRAAVSGALATYVGTGSTEVHAAPLATLATGTGSSRTLDVDLDAPTVVRGTQKAFAGRTVDLETADGTVTASTTADTTGAWRFTVAPGTYRVAVAGTRTWLDYRSRAFAAAGATVTKRSSPVRAAVITGTLTSGGRPAADVPVWLQGPIRSDEAEGDLVRTDAKGRYRFPGLVPGRFTVRFGATGDATDTTPYIRSRATRDVKAGTTTAVDAALRRGGTVTAAFDTDPGAKHWEVLLKRGGPSGEVVRSSSLTASGTTAKNAVRLSGLRTGTYLLQLADDAGDHRAERTVTVTAGRVTALGTIRPALAALTMTGSGPAGGLVQVQHDVVSRSAKVGPDGRYRVTGLVPGAYRVLTSAPGRVGTSVTVQVLAATTLDVTAGAVESTEFRRVTGTFLAGGVPVPLADIAPVDDAHLLISDGALSGAVLKTGTHRITGVRVLGTALFPKGTPYFLTWPLGDLVVPSGSDLALGTVHLGVAG